MMLELLIIRFVILENDEWIKAGSPSSRLTTMSTGTSRMLAAAAPRKIYRKPSYLRGATSKMAR